VKGPSTRPTGQLRQRRPLLVASVALAVVALVALTLLLTGFWQGPHTGAGAQSGAAASTQALPSSTPTASAGRAPKAAVPAGNANQPPPSLAAVALDKPAAVGNGITAEVVSLDAVRGTGRGPGNISGPALRATVHIINRTGRSVSLDGVAVELFYGRGRTPASPLDDPSGVPFHGTLTPGGTAEGSYVFSVPAGDRDVVTLSVGYQAGAPFLVFTGSAR
jgi:hypothetical protein